MVSDEKLDWHFGPAEIASYVDGGLPSETRARMDAHLADCAECRAEVAEVSRILNTLPAVRRPRRRVWIPAAAAAAAVLVFAWPRPTETPLPAIHREEAVTATIAPRPIAPIGPVDSLARLIWTPVPYADRYRIRVFDGAGTVLWESETRDTIGVLPGSVSISTGVPYFWKVEALTGFDRRASSELIEFVLSGARDR